MFFSSGEVYGSTEDNNTSIKEFDYGYLDPLNIRSCYGESKRMGESLFNIGSTYEYKFNNLASSKEKNIAYFKEGFGGNLVLNYIIENKTKI